MDAMIGAGNLSKRRYGIVAERDLFVLMSVTSYGRYRNISSA
jgi:hypothetical protein